MAIFRFVGNSLHNSIHGSGARGGVTKIRLRKYDGTKEEHTPNGKPHFEANDEIEVTDARAIRHLKVDPRFELVSE